VAYEAGRRQPARLEKFRAHSDFQGKHKLLKNPEKKISMQGMFSGQAQVVQNSE